MLIHIRPSINTIIRITKDEVYLREGNSTNKLSNDQIKALELDRHEISFEERLEIMSQKHQ